MKKWTALILWAFSFLPLSLFADGKEEYLHKNFENTAQKAASNVAELLVDGSQEGFATLIEGNFALTKASLLATGSSTEIRKDGKVYPVEVLGKDEGNNLVLLKIDTTENLSGFSLKSIPSLEIGGWAISVGSKGYLKGGVVSALDRSVTPKQQGGALSIFGFLGLTGKGVVRSYQKIFQHDGPVQDKEFGSALVNADGKLLGINVAYAYRGTGYAIPANYISKIFSRLKDKKYPGFLGVYVKKVDKGLEVGSLFAGGPGEKAGLKAKDILTHFEGQQLDKVEDLLNLVSQKNAGDKVTVKILRGSQEMEISIVLGKRKL